jgi:RNA polymerase subunit RPABC4/transcription elongation factor Spt4
MRYCHQCHRITTGEPLFCNHCGATYDAKLCPSRHINPRTAEVCRECGSRDLSTPAPRIPLWLSPMLYLLSLVPGVFLLLLSIMFLIAFVQAMLSDPQLLGHFLALGLLLGCTWWLYMQLPEFIRKLFRSIWTRQKKKDKSTHGH